MAVWGDQGFASTVRMVVWGCFGSLASGKAWWSCVVSGLCFLGEVVVWGYPRSLYAVWNGGLGYLGSLCPVCDGGLQVTKVLASQVGW